MTLMKVNIVSFNTEAGIQFWFLCLNKNMIHSELSERANEVSWYFINKVQMHWRTVLRINSDEKQALKIVLDN